MYSTTAPIVAVATVVAGAVVVVTGVVVVTVTGVEESVCALHILRLLPNASESANEVYDASE